MKRRQDAWGDFEEKRAERRVQRLVWKSQSRGCGPGRRGVPTRARRGRRWDPQREAEGFAWAEVGPWAHQLRGEMRAGTDGERRQRKGAEGGAGAPPRGPRQGPTRARWETKQGL